MLAEKPARQGFLAPLPWHLSVETKILECLGGNPDPGLDDAQVTASLEQYDPSELVERAAKNPLILLRDQIRNPLVLLLILAAVVSAFLGKADNVIAISAIVILNAVLGMVQEYRAEQAMAALKKMVAPLVSVRRNGKVAEVQALELVRGDLALLEAGSIVPADLRPYEAANLRVQEAALAGESEPVNKVPQTLSERNMGLFWLESQTEAVL